MPAEKTVTAEDLAKGQREISISEFFVKNKHLLGFDNPRKALLMAVKEAVDNSLDATTEAKILPEIYIEIQQNKEDRFKVIVEDNGPGIVKEQIPNIFGKLLYGSKFHRLKQSLTADEPIIVKEKDKIRVVKIGEFVEQNISNNISNFYVPCFNWQDYKYSFKKVSKVLKHKRENKIYDITTNYGKNIKVTGCHSLFTINKNTLKVEEAEARNLKEGDIILAPKKIDIHDNLNEVNILNYIEEDYAKKRFWYLYTDKQIILDLFSKAEIMHLKKYKDKSRRYYRFTNKTKRVYVLDDSYKQYAAKGFLPVWLVKFLNLNITSGVIKTYCHGVEHKIPLLWPVTPSLMKFIGLFVAEGHTDNGQIGFTFSNQERDLVKLVCDTCFMLGVNYTIEERPKKNCVRVKVFGGLISCLFRKWCGHKAKNKCIPEFVFTAAHDLRQDFLDYLYRGDGTRPENRNYLALNTTSHKLANEVLYLWLIQGVIASSRSSFKKGLGKQPSLNYTISVLGHSINTSNFYTTSKKTKSRKYGETILLLAKMLGIKYTKEAIDYLERLKDTDCNKIYTNRDFADLFDKEKIGYKIRHMLDVGYLEKNRAGYCISKRTQELGLNLQKIKKLLQSDFAFLSIKNIKVIDTGYDYVYDIAVPGAENFIGGFGGLSCHNSMGQQGIGISAVLLYGQLTTGKGMHITSKIGKKHNANFFEIHIDTQKNKPIIGEEKTVEWDKEQGTRIEVELQGVYQKGKQSVDEYVREVALINPHAQITYKTPNKELITYPRAVRELPKEPKEIKPHPHGIELGILIKMLHDTEARTLQSFLQNDFCRISAKVAKEVCEKSSLDCGARPERIAMQEAEILYNSLNSAKIMSPPTDCLSPLGEEALIKGMKKEINAEFYTTVTRSPTVYRGHPFQVEVALAYGGNLEKEEQIRIMRFANRVPLLYQQGACAATESVIDTVWRNYGLSQSKGALPAGPVVILIHVASVWVPFTSESKEAIAHYPEILKELKLALQEVGRKLATYIRKNVRAKEQRDRANLFEKYIPEVASSLSTLSGEKKEKISESLDKILKKSLKDLMPKEESKEHGKTE